MAKAPRIRLDTSRLRRFGHELLGSVQEMRDDLTVVVNEGSALGASEGKTGAPVFTGEGAGSITWNEAEVRRLADTVVVRGGWFTNKPHMVVMEEGRRPGARRPPIGPIRRWVHLMVQRGRLSLDTRGRRGPRARKAAVSGLAFVIARSIGKRGIAPRRFMERSKATVEPIFARMVEAVTDKWAGRIEKGRSG